MMTQDQDQVMMIKNYCYLLFFSLFLFSSCDYSHKTSYSYYDNGKIKYEANLKNGLRDGKLVSYYEENGGKRFEMFFRDDMPFGSSTSWYNNGHIKIETFAIDGKTEGHYKKWYENGQLQYSGFYKNGLRTGKWNVFYENGNKKGEGYYLKGNKVGNWLYRNPDGTLKEEKIYKENDKSTVINKSNKIEVSNIDLEEPKNKIIKIVFQGNNKDTIIVCDNKNKAIAVIKSPDNFMKVTIYFKAVTKSQENIKYKSRLTGYEDKWSSETTKEQITFERVPHGKFVFELLACNDSGIWNLEPSKFSFTIN